MGVLEMTFSSHFVRANLICFVLYCYAAERQSLTVSWDMGGSI